MKAQTGVMIVALVVGGSVPRADAAHGTSSATARVYATVVPSITVSEPRIVTIDLQEHQMDAPIGTQVQFLVRANTQNVELQVACTDLYRAGDPSSACKIPVGGLGVDVAHEHHDARIGGSRLLPWCSAPLVGLLPPGWTGAVTEVGLFQTTAAPTFTQNVTVGVSWQPPGPNLPIGEYTGFVRLIGMVRP